jgi:Na+-translocating ferredoxin:NAD+ oxidoreductase RnfC subunit
MSIDKDDVEQAHFIKELIAGNHLEGRALEVAQQAISKGPDSLSTAQESVLRRAMRDFSPAECGSCGNSIPWTERYQAATTGRCLGCIVR